MTVLFIFLSLLALDGIICVGTHSVLQVLHHHQTGGETRGLKLNLYNWLEVGFAVLWTWLAYLTFQSL